jgi:hypothetical protein
LGCAPSKFLLRDGIPIERIEEPKWIAEEQNWSMQSCNGERENNLDQNKPIRAEGTENLGNLRLSG